jgi:hypothetical protein
VDDLVATGFCAVEVDRAGFADREASLSSELTALLGKPISTTGDGRLVAWDLRQTRDALTARVGVAQVIPASRSLDYIIRPLSTFVAHPEFWTLGHDASRFTPLGAARRKST